MDRLAPITASTTPWRDQLAELRYLAAKVAHVHGATHPELLLLAKTVTALAESPLDHPDHHGVLGARLCTLTNSFTPWSGACGSVDQLFNGLSAVVAALPAVDKSDAT